MKEKIIDNQIAISVSSGTIWCSSCMGVSFQTLIFWNIAEKCLRLWFISSYSDSRKYTRIPLLVCVINIYYWMILTKMSYEALIVGLQRHSKVHYIILWSNNLKCILMILQYLTHNKTDIHLWYALKHAFYKYGVQIFYY